ncbi:hypothetical protein STRDD10_01704 [Streptococcus sp. DD10]|nr:hypothetical protein STRDD10_01704 [Streptococcus sp. DD10]
MVATDGDKTNALCLHFVKQLGKLGSVVVHLVVEEGAIHVGGDNFDIHKKSPLEGENLV